MRKDFGQGFFFLRQLQVRNTGCWELARARVVLLAWHHGMGDIEQREKERLRFLLQERKVQMVVLKEKNVNGDDDDDDDDDSPPL